MCQGGDLVGQLVHWDIVILSACHQKYVPRQPGRDACSLVFLIVLHLLIRRLMSDVVRHQFHHSVQKQALSHRIGERC